MSCISIGKYLSIKVLEELRGRLVWFLRSVDIAIKKTFTSFRKNSSEINAALQSANASDFIEALKAVNTLIDRRKIKYEKTTAHNCQGNSQILSILILDEATASVDVETEGKIQLALQRLIKHTTTLVIAHLPGTIRDADTIVTKGGKIIEKGLMMN